MLYLVSNTLRYFVTPVAAAALCAWAVFFAVPAAHAAGTANNSGVTATVTAPAPKAPATPAPKAPAPAQAPAKRRAKRGASATSANGASATSANGASAAPAQTVNPFAEQLAALQQKAATSGGRANSKLMAVHNSYKAAWAWFVALHGGLGAPWGNGGYICTYNTGSGSPNMYIRQQPVMLSSHLVGQQGITKYGASQASGWCGQQGVLTYGGLQAAQGGRVGKVPTSKLAVPQVPAGYGSIVTYMLNKQQGVAVQFGHKPQNAALPTLPAAMCLPQGAKNVAPYKGPWVYPHCPSPAS